MGLKTRWKLPKSLFQGPRYRVSDGFISEEVDEEKISFRMQVYRMFPQKIVLDLFAGKGYLSWLYATHGCEKLICVEKNSEYFKVLKQNLAKFDGKVEFFNMDNLDWLENCLEKIREPITYVDFDAFGCPTPQIKKFFEKYPINHALTISVTDGLIYNFRRISNLDLSEYYLQDFYLNPKSIGKPKSIQNLGEYCIQIQKQFMDILCMRFDAQAFPLYFKINSRNTAIYSSYLILPKIVGVADFKRYVGLRVVKYGTVLSKQRSFRCAW